MTRKTRPDWRSENRRNNLAVQGQGRPGDLPMLAARISISLGDYNAALASLAGLPPGDEDKSLTPLTQLYRMQSLYGLRLYDSVWQEGGKPRLLHVHPARAQLLLWLCMESGLALRKKDVFCAACLVSSTGKRLCASTSCMRLASSYAAAADSIMALSVFESTIKFTFRPAMDRGRVRELRLRSLKPITNSAATRRRYTDFCRTVER